MRYEDASGAFQASGPVANDDSDTLSAGQRGPATGNLITGEGTQYGTAGADSAAGAHVTTIAGKGGEDSSFAGGKLSVTGEHGQLSVDAEGNYSYLANKGAPENVRDRFVYTLADNQGNSDTAALIVEIGKTPAVIKADATQIVPGPDGVVTLPPGVELSDIMVVGRNLVVNMPDGTQLIIIDGAVFVPQLQLGGVEVPATNVAALLIGQEPQPAAGETPPSSGGNFALPPPPLDPGVPLGDLIPPTEYNYTPPEPQEVFPEEDLQPVDFGNIDILVDDDTLPHGRAGGIGDGPDAVNIAGILAAINNIGGDPPLTISLELTSAPEGFELVSGGPGILMLVQDGVVVRTLTVDLATGEYELTQNAPIQHPPGADENDFVLVITVTVTDVDGDTAQGTVTVTLDDDEPEAFNDTDALAIGEASTDGNVITGDETTSGAAGIDFPGADGATITAVSGAGGSDSTFEGGVLVVNGQYGVLTIDADGNYTYVKNEDAPGGVQDVFTYTLTDGDLDPVNATLTITIPDQFPDLPNPPAVLLDDDALANGNPGGTGDDVDSQGTPGQLQGSGGDGDLDYNFTGVNTLPAGFTVNVVDASTVQILQGGTVVLTVTLNNDTGAFSVVQNNPIDHPAGGDENNLSFSIGVEVEDEDGDTDPATITINVDDDTPVAVGEGFVGGQVDEDLLADGNNDSAAGDDAGGTTASGGAGDLLSLFSFGADQPGTVSLSTDTSGLPALTSNGVAVTYSVVGNVLTASAGGTDVFTLTVNADGSWEFELLDQLDHPVAGTEDNLQLDFSSIIVGEDADGDTAGLPDNSFVIDVDDDMPAPVGEPEPVTGQVDEDALADGNNDSAAGDDPGGTTASGGAGSLLSLFNIGADQPGVIVLLTDTSGLPALTSNGVVVTYSVVGNVLTASAGGTDVFTLTVNADGSWEFELLDQLDHPIAGTEDNLLLDFSSIIGAEDADGDPSDPLPEGSFVIDVDDDSPVADDEAFVGGLVDEDNLPAGNNDVQAGDDNPGNADGDNDGTTTGGNAGSLAALFDAGADQPLQNFGLLTDTSGLPALTSNGVVVTYLVVGNVLTASAGGSTVFTLTVNADGSWTFDLEGQLDHPVAGTEDNLQLDLSSIIMAEDADGDPATAADGTFVITVDDDLPVADGESFVGGLVDEDDLPDGNSDNAAGDDDPGNADGDNDGTTTGGNAGSLAALFNVGADQPMQNFGLLTDTSGLPVLHSNGVLVTYAVVGDTLTASAGGSTVFTLTVNADGSWTFDLEGQLDHPTADTEDNLDLDFSSIITAEDADGDPATAADGTFVITVDDDLPVPAGEPFVGGLVDEDNLPNGNNDNAAGDDNPGNADGDNDGTTTGGGAPSLLTLFNIGADQPGTISLSTDTSGLPALTSNGVVVTYAVVGDTLTASAGGSTVFTLTVNADGSWEFDLEGQLDHQVDDTEDNLNLDLSSIIVAEDADGDTATAPEGSFVITVDDDLPVAANDTDTVGAPGTTATGNVITDAEGDGGADSVGADEPGTITALASNNEPGNSDTDPSANFEIQGEFGVLVMNADGSYTYTRDPGTPGGAVEVFTYTLTDADGDSTTATLTITLGDATPVLPDPALVRLDDDALSDGNPGGPNDDPDSAGLPGQLNGSGGDAPLTYNFTGVDTLPGGFTAVPVDASTVEIYQGATLVLTITLNNATGAFNVVQENPIDHPSLDGMAGDNTENNLVFQVGVEVEDSDGDVEPATITINVDDDSPEANDEASVTGLVDEDNLPAGNDDVQAGDDDPGNADGDNDGTTAGGGASSLFALFSFGADQPGTVSLSTDTSGLPALTSNGVAVTYLVVGDTLTASAGGSTVFTLQVNADGSWTFDLEGQLDHPTADTEDNIDIDFSSIIIGEDNDGDEVTAADGTFVVTVDDDLPVPAGDVNPVTGQVDEDLLADGNNDSAAGDDPGTTTASGGVGSLLSLFNIGADQPGTVSLSTDTSGLPALTSNGVVVTYSVVGDTLTASAGGTDVFTLQVNADGSWTFTLLDQLDHPVVDTEDNLLLDFSSIIIAEDADGDTATLPDDSFVIDVDDDMPTAFDPDPITTGVENMAGETATADLDVDGNIDDNVGADQPGVVRFTNIANGDDSGFDSGGVNITYWLSNDGQTLQGRINSTDGTDGTLIFQIDLNQDQGPGDDTYTITMFGTIDNGAGVSFDDLTSTAAGNVEVRGVGADDPLTTVDLMISAGPNPATTVNTDSDSIGAANQSMDDGETIRIDFITNLEDDPADDLGTFPNGFSYDNHVSTNSFIGFIPQVQGSQGETVAFTVYALDTADDDGDAPDRDPTGGFGNSTITTITEVTIDGFDAGETEVSFDITGFTVGVFTPLAYGISVRPNADGSVTFSGIQQGDSYGFSTVGEGDFNAVVVESEAAGTGGSSEDSFDLGVFSIGIVDTGDPINLSYDLELTDADGDSVTVTDALQITIAPDTSESLAATSFAAESSDTSSFSLLASDSEDQQVQKTAANSNTLTLATAIAAAGISSKAAAHDNGHDGHGPISDLINAYAPEAVEQFSVADDSGDAAVSMLAPEASAEQSAPADSSSSSSADDSSAGNSLDDSSAPAAADSSGSASSGDEGPAPAANDAAPVAPAVAMVSAEALQAAGVDGDAEQGGSVEQVVADALGQGDAPTVDAVLANLPGGIGQLGAIAHMASPASEAVSGWDMAGHGAIGAGHDMMLSMHAPNMHHDAVQPVVNG